jgi:radical SAM protein with 4Fe4S-binding SPASM domain
VKTFGFQWHVTDRCNLRCSHCYQDDFSASSELDVRDLRVLTGRLLTGLEGRSVSVNITGGEPLLFPHLPDLIARLHQADHLSEIHLITNATVSAPDVLGMIREAPRIKSLKVSVESVVDAVNDAIRGQGNLEKVRTHIAVYREQTLKPVVLMVTLGGHNLQTIDQTLQFAKSVEASGIIFERFVPLGQGTGMRHEVLTPAGRERAAATLSRLAGLPPDGEALLPYHAFWLRLQPSPGLEGALCNLGGDSMALMPDGTVYPCRRLPMPVGNALELPFSSILEKLEGFSIRQTRQRLRGDLCGLCGIEACAGCRAMARAINSDYLADDPGCPLRIS